MVRQGHEEKDVTGIEIWIGWTRLVLILLLISVATL